MAEMQTIDVQATPVVEPQNLQQAIAANNIDPAYAQRQMLEQDFASQAAEVAGAQQAFAEHAQMSAQKAAILEQQRQRINPDGLVAKTAAVAVGGGVAYKAGEAALKFRNADALAGQVGNAVAKQIEKSRGFGIGKFRIGGNFDLAKAQQGIDKTVKDKTLASAAKDQLASLASKATNGDKVDVAKMATNLQDEAGKALREGNDFKEAAADVIKGKKPEWLTTAAQQGQAAWKGLTTSGKIAIGTTLVVAGGLIGNEVNKNIHKGGKQQAAMLDQQIEVAKAEAAQSAEKAEAVGSKWQDYLRAREAAPALAAGAQLG